MKKLFFLAFALITLVNVSAQRPAKPENPGFETGDLKGWTVLSGKAFSTECITKDTKFWDVRDFNQEGKYHYHGAIAGESATGKMKSTTFTISGKGEISILLGAGKEISKCYVAVVDASNDKILLKQGNTRFKDPEYANNYQKYTLNAAKYIGKSVYILIVDDDNRPGDFAFINVDGITIR